MTRRGERGIWQRRYWEHTIRDDRDFAGHFDYIHFNPVKHGLVRHPADWCIQRFAAAWPTGFTQPAGLTAVPNRRKPASGNQRALQRARPTASVVGGMRCEAGQEIVLLPIRSASPAKAGVYRFAARARAHG
jgi:hypothetical protein